jgi:DNA-binding transcriptional LysR family regulator
MRLDWLRAFRAVMQTGTVTSAAAMLFRTQPQVSRMIASLETALGLRLFDREGRRLVPTEHGLQFFQYVEPLLIGLDGAAQVARDIRSNRGRPLVVAAEPFLLQELVPHALSSLGRTGDFTYALEVCMRGLGLWMARGNADLGVVALPFSQTDMEQVIFAEAEVVVALPAGHPLLSREIVTMRDLISERFIALRTSTLLRVQIDIQGVALEPAVETAAGPTACDLVARGVGVTIADPIVAMSFRARGVEVRPLDAGLRLTYGYLLAKGSEASEPHRRIMQAIAASAAGLGGRFVTLLPSWKDAGTTLPRDFS